MKPAPFHYVRPHSVAEAVQLLAAHGPGAKLLAGGQSLMPLMVRRLQRPELVIDITRIAGLDRIEVLPTQLRMGALVSQEQAQRSAVVRAQGGGVAQALAWVANPVVRQRGTVIGNLVANGPGAELPAVALALGAEFILQYADREELVPAADLLGAQRSVPRGAMITHVLWPRRRARIGFYEVARRAGHAPVVSSLVMLGDAECRVSLSGVCRTGLSCPSMARVIAQQSPRLPSAGELAAALQEDLTGPVWEDPYTSARYRLEVAPVVSQRAVQLTLPAEAA